MIYRERDLEYSTEEYCDLLLDGIVLSDFDEQLQHLVNLDCALALSVCKSRNFPSCVFVLSLLYMKRVRSSHLPPSLMKINNLTTKELYLITTLLANKYLIDEGEDEQLFNSELAELSGLTTERVNLLEKQILVALAWDLYISNEEFQEFFALFKNHLIQKLNKSTDKLSFEDSVHFYHLCLTYLPQMVEYVALASIVLLGSTLSILTAVHLSTMTHSTLMKTLHPRDSYLRAPNCSWKQPNNEQEMSAENALGWIYSNRTNENFSPSKSSSCSLDLLQPHAFFRPVVQTLG